MIKSIFFALIFFSYSFAKVIGGISVLVDSQPITTFEIREFAKKYNISLNDALNALIQQKLEEEEIKRLGIVATNQEINAKLQELAKANKMDMDTFLKELQKEGKSLYELKQQIAKTIKKEKLYQKILAGSIKKPTKEDLKRLYELNKDKLNMPTKIDVIQYAAKEKERLIQKLKTPAFPIEGVYEHKATLFLKKIPPELAKLLLSTKEGAYTPILNVNGNYITFKVLKKYKKHISFEEAKPKLLMAYINERKQAKLIEYFEKKKAEATIKIIRKP